MSPKLRQWVDEPPPTDVRQALERPCRDDDVHRVAVMPDVHLSKEVCVGVAVATHRTLIPAAVGGDVSSRRRQPPMVDGAQRVSRDGAGDPCFA